MSKVADGSNNADKKVKDTREKDNKEKITAHLSYFGCHKT